MKIFLFTNRKIWLCSIFCWLWFVSCNHSSEQLCKDTAIISIPNHPSPTNWNVLEQCYREASRLNPNMGFILCDWNDLLKKVGPQKTRQLDTLFATFGEKWHFAPKLTPNAFRVGGMAEDTAEKKRYYHIDKHGCLFLILDSSDLNSSNRISTRQIGWLKDLQGKAEETDFVIAIVDKPLWDITLFPGENNWWSDVHPILELLNTNVVIAGHEGYYALDQKRDDIQYVRSAGASDTLLHRFHLLGNFPHFLWLSVDDDDFSISPIEIGNILPDSIKTIGMMQQAKKAYQEVLSHPEFELPQNLRWRYRREVGVNVTNPWKFTFGGKLTWHLANSDWRIYPENVTYNLGPGKERTYRFNIWMQSNHSINRNLPYLTTKIPPAKNHSVRQVRRFLVPVKEMTIYKTNMKFNVDGSLNEWEGIQPLLLSEQYLVTNGSNWSSEDLSAAIYATWDSSGLYLGIDVEDNEFVTPTVKSRIRNGDCVELGFDGSYDRFVPGFNKNDHNFGFAFSEKGPVVWRWHGPPESETGQTFTIPFSFQRFPGHTIYEIFLPADELKPISFQDQTYFGFNVAIHDNDGNDWERAIQWTAGLMGEPYPALFGKVTME